MNLDLIFYWKLFWRRLPVMMLFILVCSTMGVITAMKLPETWSSSARLLVEAPQIPDNMVASTVQMNAIEQLDIIQQKLLTRANLIDIANEFEVFENIRDMQPDRVVEAMRSATRVRRTAGRNQATLLTIQFQARTGSIAANVTNRYVTLVLEENADLRVSRAENTLTFFEQEVERLGQELDQQSTQIAVFKSDNIDALPEDQSFRQGRQSLLQERLSRLERDQTAATAQRAEIVRIYENTGTINPAGAAAAPRRTREQEQLIVAQAELEQALSVYSETHPRVIRLQSRIDRLEAIVAAQNGIRAQDAAAAEAATAEDAAAQEGQLSPERAILQASLAEIDGRIDFLASDIEDTTEELEALQGSITRSSAVGIELSALERDYANIQARYNAAVNNLNSARMSERIETTAQGQRITVIENANVPRVPTGPNRPRIAIMGAALGMGLAGAYFVLLELLNRSVRRPAELVGRFNVTPITVIPYMESRWERFLRRSAILAATAVVLVGVPLTLWYVDTNYLPLEIVVQKGLARLGLG